MNQTGFKQSLSCLVCIVLVAAMALMTTGCGKQQPIESTTGDKTVLGDGATTFAFSVFDKDGSETAFEIHTDETVVGEALQSLGLIKGEDSTYGLYVKTVNGLTLDYDADGYYWSFYIDGEYAMTGVDKTDIEEGAFYAFKAEHA